MLQLMQTERHAVGLEAAIPQCQLNGLLHLLGRVLPGSAQDAHELAHASPVPAVGAQAG